MKTHDDARKLLAIWSFREPTAAEAQELGTYIDQQEATERERHQQAARLERIKSHAGSTAQKLDEELQEADDASRRSGYEPELRSPAFVIDDLHAKLQEAEKRAVTAEQEVERLRQAFSAAEVLMQAALEQARAEGYERGKAERDG